eukprot:15019586-Alexandrium_andersonii.AAC.1
MAFAGRLPLLRPLPPSTVVLRGPRPGCTGRGRRSQFPAPPSAGAHVDRFGVKYLPLRSAGLPGGAGPLRRQIRHLREKRRRTHPSRASGTDFEAVPGPAQFQ